MKKEGPGPIVQTLVSACKERQFFSIAFLQVQLPFLIARGFIFWHFRFLDGEYPRNVKSEINIPT